MRKTGRRTLAAVAAGALGAGLLIGLGASPASAAVTVTTPYQFVTTGNGICFASNATPGTGVTSIKQVVLGAVAAADAGFNLGNIVLGAANDSVTMEITSGPGVISAAASGTNAPDSVAGDGLSVSWTATAAGTAGATISVLPTATGTINLSLYNTNTGVIYQNYQMFVVNACTNGGYDAANSATQLSDTATALAARPAGDVAGAATQPWNGTAYYKMWLRDQFGQPISNTGNALVATATNGAQVAWGGIPASGTAVTTSGLSTQVLTIVPGATNLYKPVTTTVTVQLNGVTVGTRTVTFTGVAAAIKVSGTRDAIQVGVNAATAPNATAFRYTVEDSAGNRLTGVTVGTAAVTGSITGLTPAGTSLATGGVAVGAACSATVPGKGTAQLATVAPNGTTVLGPVVDLLCSYAVIRDFKVEFTPAAMQTSSTVRVTVSATDPLGQPVADLTPLTGLQYAMSGLFGFDPTPDPLDTFTSGQVTYVALTTATAGRYSGTWSLITDEGRKVKELTYNIGSTVPKSLTINAYRESGAVTVEGDAPSFDTGATIRVDTKRWNAKKDRWSSWKETTTTNVRNNGTYKTTFTNNGRFKVRVQAEGVKSNVITVAAAPR